MYEGKCECKQREYKIKYKETQEHKGNTKDNTKGIYKM